jgi:hypothetical protein
MYMTQYQWTWTAFGWQYLPVNVWVAPQPYYFVHRYPVWVGGVLVYR